MCVIKKNDDIKVEITAVSVTGSGIGHVNGMAVFVEQTAVGDIVTAHIIKVNKKYAVGKIKEIIIPSKDRKSVDCGAFKSCGGCSFRHLKYECELKIKYTAVYDAMKRIGGIDKKPLEIIPSPLTKRYRNKAQYPLCMGENGLEYGFYAKHSHRIVKSETCFLQPEIFDKITAAFKIWADKYRVSVYDETKNEGILRHLLIRIGENSGEIMVVVVVNNDDLPYKDELFEILNKSTKGKITSLQYNINKSDTNVVLGNVNIVVAGSNKIYDSICGVKVGIFPNSFYQVNTKAAEILYEKALSYIDSNDNIILDLFCGIGSIGLSALKICGKENRKLIGVEIVNEAVENAKENAAMGGYDNCDFICADAKKAAEILYKHRLKPDVVIVDPPRKGCDKGLLDTLCSGFSPKKIIYISCDPATLARDAKILEAYQYKLFEYTPADLFPGTAHVETVGVFENDKIIQSPAPFSCCFQQ